MANEEQRRMRGVDRRRQILTVATEVFGRRGYRGSALRDVADGCGVTEPLVYKYFPSKRELFLETLRHADEQITEAWREESCRETTAMGRLLALARVYENPSGHEISPGLLIQARAEAGRDPQVHDAMEGIFRTRFGFIRELVAQAQAEGSVDPAVSTDAVAWQLLCVAVTSAAVSTMDVRFPGAISVFRSILTEPALSASAN